MKETYFAKVAALEEGEVPVAVCRFPPKWWTGLNYIKAAPEEWLLKGYKEGEINEVFFIANYVTACSKMGREVMERDLLDLTGQNSLDNVVLVCYEKDGDFCHRHILKRFLEGEDFGLRSQESTEDTQQMLF